MTATDRALSMANYTPPPASEIDRDSVTSLRRLSFI